MLSLTLQEVAQTCGGRLEAADSGERVRTVSIDSRSVGSGDLFVGIKGERFDGDTFAAVALAAGATAVVVRADTAAGLPARAPRIVVEDGLTALGALAAEVRRRLAARVVAITGSTGKTSTKDILAALLRPVARVVATRGNLNNEIGVPLTLLAADEQTEVVVTELAMRGRGQIRALAHIVAPDVGVITNVAPVHLELVGTMHGVAAAKAELIEVLGGNTVVVPGDEPLLQPYLRRHRGRVVTFGDLGSHIHLVDVEYRQGAMHAVVDAFGRRTTLEFNFTGGHYLTDALAALGAFVELGYPLTAAREGARHIEFSELRGEIVELPGGGFLLNDSYNANPLAMRASLDHLLDLADERPAVAVLGDMYELGAESVRFHAEVGAYAAGQGVLVVAVGALARGYLTGTEGERWFASVDDCLAALPEVAPPGSAILVKASRAARLERVAEAIVAAGRVDGSAHAGEDPRD